MLFLNGVPWFQSVVALPVGSTAAIDDSYGLCVELTPRWAPAPELVELDGIGYITPGTHIRLPGYDVEVVGTSQYEIELGLPQPCRATSE